MIEQEHERQTYRNILSTEITAEEDKALVEYYRKNQRAFIESFLWIETKSQGLIRFKFNAAQVYVWSIIEKLQQEGKPVKLIVLKGRQVGLSTLIEALLFCRTILWPNTTTFVVGHLETTARKVFRMSKVFLDNLPDYMRPMVSSRTKNSIEFANPDSRKMSDNPGLMSTMLIATAKNKDIGAGFTLHGLHLTEFSRYDNPKEVLLSLMKSVPNDSNALVAIESTAMNAAEFYRELWERAVKGKSGWTPVFIPFWMMEEYEQDVSPVEEHDYKFENLRDYEKKWWTEFPELRNPRKLKWARWDLSTNCGGSLSQFCQESAPSSEECFSSQGQTVFDQNALRFYREKMVTEGERGILTVNKTGRPIFIPSELGKLTIWKHPKRGELYTIGGDGSMGSREVSQRKKALEEGEEGEAGSDFSAAIVMSAHREQVAQYRTRVADPYDFAETLAMLGKYYNVALINIEGASGGGNTAGYGILARLKMIYPRLWRWEKVDKFEKHTETEYLGWEPTVKSKPKLLAMMMRELRRGAGIIHAEEQEWDHIEGIYDKRWPRMRLYSHRLLLELNNYTLNGAKRGRHDDLVIALGLAILALEQIPVPSDVPQAEQMSMDFTKKTNQIAQEHFQADDPWHEVINQGLWYNDRGQTDWDGDRFPGWLNA